MFLYLAVSFKPWLLWCCKNSIHVSLKCRRSQVWIPAFLLFFLLYFCPKFLLQQEFRQPLLDSTYPKLMLWMVKSRLSKLIDIMSFQSWALSSLWQLTLVVKLIFYKNNLKLATDPKICKIQPSILRKQKGSETKSGLFWKS